MIVFPAHPIASARWSSPSMKIMFGWRAEASSFDASPSLRSSRPFR